MPLAKTRNSGAIPQGMLAPAGLSQTPVDPFVQDTTRPPGSLLAASPGYDSIRPGKNRFQGRGPTGGFRPMEFAEDIGGGGAALSVVPGDIGSIADTEWLPENEGEWGDIPEGSMIISDRGPLKRYSHILHEASHVVADMGDRTVGRPLTNSLLRNPGQLISEDYRKNPILTVGMVVGGVTVAWLIGREFDRNLKKGKGVTAEAESAPSAAVNTTDKEATGAIDTVGKAADAAIKSIEDAANKTINALDKVAD